MSRRLAGGVSGADVFLLERDAQRVVLKVTADPRWIRRARAEFLLYTELAHDLGLSVPTVLAAQSDDAAVRILMRVYEPHPASPVLDVDAWVELAVQLGRLHRPRTVLPTWTKRRLWPSDDEVAQAIEQWSALGHGTLAQQAAVRLSEACAGLNSLLPSALVHGDCHVGNLLLSNRQTVWADWQEVSIGTGPEDLALLWQRAEFDGASPPRAAMIDAYCAARDIPNDADLGRALACAELRLLLIDWPAYLPYNSDDRRRRMVQRLQSVIADVLANS